VVHCLYASIRSGGLSTMHAGSLGARFRGERTRERPERHPPSAIAGVRSAFAILCSNHIEIADGTAKMTAKVRSILTDPLKVRKNDPGRSETGPAFWLLEQSGSRSQIATKPQDAGSTRGPRLSSKDERTSGVVRSHDPLLQANSAAATMIRNGSVVTRGLARGKGNQHGAHDRPTIGWNDRQRGVGASCDPT
jgi:hypothetical protein